MANAELNSKGRRIYVEGNTYNCKCGCDRAVEIKPYHKQSYGVPDYINGHSRKGKECTEEHKRKVSEGNKRYLENKDNYDKKVAATTAAMRRPEVREKIRQSKLGSTLSQEIRDKISKTKKNNEPTEKEIKSRKENLNVFEKGSIPWNRGKKQPQDVIDNRVNKLKGQKRTKEYKQLMSEKMTQRILDNNGINPCYTYYKKGYYYSKKNDKNIHYDSSYELAAYKILEKLSNVKFYSRCNFYIEYDFNGINKRYIPDIFVTYNNNKKEIIEIKPKRLAQIDNKNKMKFKAGNKYCKDKGFKFSVWTEDKIFI